MGRLLHGKITRKEVDERFERQSQDTYMEWLSITKNITWLLVATALVAILYTFDGVALVERLAYLVATICVSLIPVATYARGLIFHTKRQNILDDLLPALMALFAILQFLSLSVGTKVALIDTSDILRLPYTVAWFYFVAAHALTASALVTNRLMLFRITDFEPELETPARTYRKMITGDLFGALAFGLGALLIARNFAELNSITFGSVDVWGDEDFRLSGSSLAVAGIAAVAVIVTINADIGRAKLRQMVSELK